MLAGRGLVTVDAERGGHALQGWSPLQAPVRLANAGVDTCTAANITAHSHTPVLTLCRKMIAAGIDPATELQVFRGDTLALTFRNIGEAAKLTVRESRSDGRPRYIPAE